MSDTTTNWLVGYVTFTSSQTATINGNNVVIPAGTYPLRHATAALGLVGLLQTGFAAVVGGTTVVVCKDRKVRVISGAGALTLTFPAALQLALGMSGAPTVGTTVAAVNVSNLLWSPGWRGRPLESPMGIVGRKVHDAVQTVSPTGETAYTTRHHTQVLQGWAWQFVVQARMWTSDDGLPGQFARFYTDVLSAGCRFAFYETVSEDDTSTTAVTWSTRLGLYRMRLLEGDEWYKRAVEQLDTWAHLSIEAFQTAEP
jgi:hypothetical protein